MKEEPSDHIKFTNTEKRMMKLFYQTKAHYTVYELAKELNISYQTAKKYSERLIKLGIINRYKDIKDPSGKVILRFRRNLLKEILGIRKRRAFPKEITDGEE